LIVVMKSTIVDSQPISSVR